MTTSILFVFLVLSFFLEPLLFHSPITLVALSLFAVFQKKIWVFLLAVISGLIIDSISFFELGISSIYFSLVVGILFLYSRKFQTRNIVFYFLFIFIAIFCNLLFLSPGQVLLRLVISLIFAVIFYLLLLFLTRNKRLILEGE